VWIKGKKLTKIDKQAMYDYTFSQQTKDYWSRKHHLTHEMTHEMITNINWEACKTSLNKLPFGKRCWLLKHATGFCGVGKMEKLRGNKDHDACPRCGMTEDAPHVVRCQGAGTDAIFKAAVSKLELTMGDKFTAPEIITVIGKRIRQWRKLSKSDIIDHATPFRRYHRNDKFGTKAAVAEQDKIGWYNMLLGRLSPNGWMHNRNTLNRLENEQPAKGGLSPSLANSGTSHGTCGNTATTLSITHFTPKNNWRWSYSDCKSTNGTSKDQKNY
jgi:hypothetical protein